MKFAEVMVYSYIISLLQLLLWFHTESIPYLIMALAFTAIAIVAFAFSWRFREWTHYANN